MHLANMDPLVRCTLASAQTARIPKPGDISMDQAVRYFCPLLGDGDDPSKAMSALRRFVDGFMVRAFNKQFFAGRRKDFESFDSQRVLDLYDLGYLPVEVRILPDGLPLSPGTPMLEIRSTNVMFKWIVDALAKPMSVVAAQCVLPPGFCSVSSDNCNIRCRKGMSLVSSRLDKRNLFRQVFFDGRMTGPKLERVL